MRRRQSLRGTNRLGKDALAQLRSKPAWRDQVHLAAQERLEPILDLEEMEVADRPVEFDEQVGVASGGRLVARHGAEHRQAPDAELAELPSCWAMIWRTWARRVGRMVGLTRVAGQGRDRSRNRHPQRGDALGAAHADAGRM